MHKRTDLGSVDLALKQSHGLAVAGFFFEIAVCEVKKDTDIYFNLYVISARGQRSPGPPDRGSAPGPGEGFQGGVEGDVRVLPDVWTHWPVLYCTVL